MYQILFLAPERMSVPKCKPMPGSTSCYSSFLRSKNVWTNYASSGQAMPSPNISSLHSESTILGLPTGLPLGHCLPASFSASRLYIYCSWYVSNKDTLINRLLTLSGFCFVGTCDVVKWRGVCLPPHLIPFYYSPHFCGHRSTITSGNLSSRSLQSFL